MLWITRSHVHVDRVACPWLITRFIDNDAEFLFVPKNQIEKVVKETGAIPFDAPGVELGHVDGRCSFESILAKYDLKEPGLLRLAKTMRTWRPSSKSMMPCMPGAAWMWRRDKTDRAAAGPERYPHPVQHAHRAPVLLRIRFGHPGLVPGPGGAEREIDRPAVLADAGG